MDDAVWSRHFANQVAQMLGYRLVGASAGAGLIDYDAQAEQLVGEITEAFRYLPAQQIQYALDYAEFLRARKIDGYSCPVEHLQTWVPEKLREVRDLVLLLRHRYGSERPADEKDYWTEEDERDFSFQSWKRLEEEDPWPEDDSYHPKQEGGDAQTG